MFLLGAGASVPAGGVGLGELRRIFERTLRTHQYADQLGSVYLWVTRTLTRRLGYEPDFELVLTAIQDLYDYFSDERVEVPEYKETLDGDVVETSRDVWFPVRSTLHYFFDPPTDPFVSNALDGQWGFVQTVNDLRVHFRRCLDAMVRHIDPQRTPLGFIPELARTVHEPPGPIDVFTLNYDTLMEEICDRESVPWSTGFSPNWSPGEFDREGLMVRIHKLHGSVWWETGRLLEQEAVDRVVERHQIAEIPFLIYPLLVKSLGHPIIAELFARFGRALLSTRAAALIGSSLADTHLCETILFGMSNNRDLRVYIVDPNAHEVKRQLLRPAIRHDIVDEIRDRIVPIPKGIEDFDLRELGL